MLTREWAMTFPVPLDISPRPTPSPFSTAVRYESFPEAVLGALARFCFVKDL
jgi:hypothetical protein